jgi:TetR/AcrR family transcriptional repressor of mexJK operon
MNHEVAVPEAPAESLPRKRRQMLEAATALFIERGYGAVSMDAVARAAGVSKATLYAHFASKDALFATIIGEACRSNLVAAEFYPADVEDVAAALTAIGGRVLRFLVDPQRLAIFRVVISESVRFPELGAAFMENGPAAFRDRFVDWVATQTRAGRLNAEDPKLAAEQFMALLRSGIYLRASLSLPPAPTEAEIDATVNAAVGTFLKAFG